MANVQKTYALVLGIVLAIVGIWGLFTNSILGIFGVNLTQSIVHLIGAAFGLYAGLKGDGAGFNAWLGRIGVILGVLGFIPTVGHNPGEWLNTVFNINSSISLLHIVIGVVSLGVFYWA